MRVGVTDSRMLISWALLANNSFIGSLFLLPCRHLCLGPCLIGVVPSVTPILSVVLAQKLSHLSSYEPSPRREPTET